jgi:hypothetical protein
MMRTILAVVCCLLCAGSVWAGRGGAAQPTEPVAIADFETAESVAAWTGIPHDQTDAHASSGRHGMRYDIPKWNEERGDEPRPGVKLLYNDGAGYPFKDWSQYKAIVVDVWVLGDGPGQLGLKTIDGTGTNSWTTHIDVAPGQKNEALLLIDDAAADSDVTDVREVVLYSLRPKSSFTLVVDNLRLLPREKPPVATFDLMYPNYRGLVFPDGGDIEVSACLELAVHGLRPRQVAVHLSLESPGEKTGANRVCRVRRDTSRFGISAATMPEGEVTLTASLVRSRTKETLAEAQWDLRMIGRAEMDALATYVDRHNTLIVDGKPFFPLGWYSGMDPGHRDEIADSPYNTLLVYGTNRVPKDEMTAYLDSLQEKGLKLIYCMNDVYPTATYYDGKNWEGVTGNAAIAAAATEAYKDHPAMLAWYLNDELPHTLAPDLEEYYTRFKTADPDHPCFIVLCNKKDLPLLQHTTDIIAGDPYPMPKEPVTRVSDMMARSQEAVHGAKPVWLVPQAFAWYQHNSKNPDRSHIPTEQELLDGRAPTYEEGRAMTYLGLVHGAKGLVYWCYYNMRMLPQYEEMWAWMKDIGSEVQALSPMLLSPGDLGPAAFEPADAPIQSKLKLHNGRLYLMAVNGERETCRVTFALPRKVNGPITVMFEDRALEARGKRFTDAFEPLAVHVYDLGLASLS